MRKIKSFTILELILTMTVTTVIIGLVYSLLLIFNQRFLFYVRKSKSIDEYILFNKRFEEDVELADFVTTGDNLEYLSLNMPNSSEVTYVFEDSCITRLFAETKNYFYLEKVSYSLDTSENTEKARVWIRLKMYVDTTEVQVSVLKEYVARQRMNRFQK